MHFFGKVLVTTMDITIHTLELVSAYVEHYMVRN